MSLLSHKQFTPPQWNSRDPFLTIPHRKNKKRNHSEVLMTQLSIPNLQEDILASSLRRERNRLEELINDVKYRSLSFQKFIEIIKNIEKDIRRLRAAA